MAKELCIWNKQEHIARFMGKPEESATYEQMISAGWKPTHEGEVTVVFAKDSSCNSSQEVHTESK